MSLLFRSLELDEGQQELTHYCNDDCNCTVASYDPTCGQDAVQYFTPCHAGCENVFNDIDGHEVRIYK
jgi:hypothetical protein